MQVFMTEITEEWKNENGFQTGDLSKLLANLPDDLDVRIDSMNGEELLETIQSNCGKEKGDPADEGYQYLLLKAQDIDTVHEVFNSELDDLTSIRQELSSYHQKLRNRENGTIAAAQFVDAVEKILGESYEPRSI